jgi:fructuronate reductase
MSEKSGLSRGSAPQSALIVKGSTPKTGIVHLGLGNFHRAHLAVYTAKAVAQSGGDWGIYAYSFRSKTLSEALNKQDLLYSVIDFAPNTEAVCIPAIHTAAVAGHDQVHNVINEIAKSGTKIISITVTEAGYSISPRTNGLELDSADIQSDLAGNAPKTLVGVIVRGLEKRLAENNEPISVMSCDNLSSNGDRTKKQVMEFIDALPNSASLKEYVTKKVTFPNSMVDRIVPGTEARHISLAQDRLGVHDSSPVPAEPFSMWAVEDNFIAGRPAWENVGVIFTNQVELFEIMKLRLLNGAHSLLAYFGALDNQETIPDARFQPFIEASLRAVLFKEYLPTLTMPTGLSAEIYIEQLFSRWSNTVLGDKTNRVGSDGSTKLPQRITAPAIELISKNQMPEFLALTVAAWLACIAPLNRFEPGVHARAMKDPAQPKLLEFAERSTSAAVMVKTLFSEGNIFAPELAALDGFQERIAEYLDLVIESGIHSAADLALQRSDRLES